MNKKTPSITSTLVPIVLFTALITGGGMAVGGGVASCCVHYEECQKEKEIRERFKNFCEGDTAAKLESLDDTYDVKKYFHVVKEFAQNPNTKKLVGKCAKDDHWEYEIVNPQDKKLGKDYKSALRLENWKAVNQFMWEAKIFIDKLQYFLEKPAGTDREKNMFYKFYEKFDSKIVHLGDEYSYIKDSYRAVKEFYAFPNAKKLIKVSVPGEDGKHHHWEFKAVDRCSSDDDSQLTDWQAVESFMYIAESSLSLCGMHLVKIDLEDYRVRYLPRNLKEKFKHIEDSLEAAKGFVKDPKSKCLVRISNKDEKGVHDHWEFKLIDRGSDLSELDGDEQLLMLDWYALDSFNLLIKQTSIFANGCDDWKKEKLYNMLEFSEISFRGDIYFEQVNKFLRDPKNKTLIQTTSDEGGKRHRVFKTIDREDFSQNQSVDATDFEAVENYVNAVAGYSTKWITV